MCRADFKSSLKTWFTVIQTLIFNDYDHGRHCNPHNDDYDHDGDDDDHLSTEKPTSVTSCLYSFLSQSWMINLNN